MKTTYDKASWDVHHEFVSTLFISWAEFADSFGLTKEWDLADTDKPPSKDIVEVAFIEAQHLAKKHNEIYSEYIPEEDVIKTENKILKSIVHHWSPQNIIPQYINIPKLVSIINKWCNKGPNNQKLFPVEPPKGTGIEYFISARGISFSIYPPFMTPYTELYYAEYDDLPEWNIESIISSDILEILLTLHVQQQGIIEIDLSEWDTKRKPIEDLLTSSSFEI